MGIYPWNLKTNRPSVPLLPPLPNLCRPRLYAQVPLEGIDQCEQRIPHCQVQPALGHPATSTAPCLSLWQLLQVSLYA